MIRFDVPSGKAIKTLKTAAKQANVEVLYTAAVVKGVKTNSVREETTIQVALDTMLAGTQLEAVQDEVSGAFAIRPRKEENNENAAIPEAGRDTTENSELEQLEVNTKKNFLTALKTVLATAVAGSGAQASAQDDEEEIFELSPFSVSAADDTGYRATSTVAGTRIKTPLRDVGAAISVITQEFLEDTNSTDAEDLLVYVANAEVDGLGGNYSGANFRTDRITTERTTRFGSGNVRLRGLSGATNTRNFYLSAVPFDSYNVSRVLVNRGPNAILFGLGSPAGIVNYGLKQAQFANSNEFGVQFSSHNSQRYHFDVNRELVEDELAIRVTGLYDDQQYKQEPAYETDQRVFATLDYSPKALQDRGVFKRSTIRASYENGEIDSNRPRTQPPYDTFTLWWDHANQQTVPSHTLEWNQTNRNLFSIPGTWWFQPGVVFGDHTSAAVGGPGATPGAFMAITQSSHTAADAVPRFPGFRGIATFQDWAAGRSGYPAQVVDGAFYRDIMLLDESVFDYRNKLLDGPNKWESADFDVVNLSFEQELFEGNVGFELAYNKESADNAWYDTLNQEGYNIHVDPNSHYPWGAPNPNVGRPFVATLPQAQEQSNDRETLRATVYFKLDFRERFDGALGKILGRHNVTGLFNDYEYNQQWLNWNGNAPDETWMNNFGRTNQVNGNIGQGRIMRYLGDSFINASTYRGADIPNLQVEQRVPSSVPTTYWDTTTDEWVTRDIGFRTYYNSRYDIVERGGKQRQTIDSQAAILQSYFLDDMIVGMVGWREDEFESFRNTNPARRPDGTRNLDDPNWVLTNPNGFNKEQSVSYSVVAHAPDFINQMFPDGSRLSASFNVSENFQPGAQRFDALGRELGPPTGETEDFGLTLELLDGKLFAKVNVFETKETGVSLGSPTGATIIGRDRESAEGYSTGINDGNPQLASWALPPQEILNFYGWSETANPDGSITVDLDPQGSIATVADRVTEGVEFEMIYNPTKNWRILFNVSQVEAVQNGVDPALAELYALRKPVWDATSGLWNDPAQNFTSGERRWEVFEKPYNLQVSQDGKALDELREWRWNMVSSYDFKEGRMNGFGVGGALRWQDDVGVGYPVRDNPVTGDREFDIDNPYFSGKEFNGDFWLSYGRKISNDRIDWKIRLNARNLIGEEDLIVIAAQPSGQPSGVRIPQGTIWQLSNTFKF